MKITIKNIIKENKDIDPKQRFVNGISKIIRLPYFNFLEVNEVPEELWNDILTKVFNQEVIISDNVIYDLNDKKIYFEYSDGYWEKREYDSNNNQIYYENSDGDWLKTEYDENNNQIYYENSNGYWSKSEYDENNNVIYYENSNGTIRDKRTINPIKENKDINPKEKYINGIVNIIRLPYFNFLRVSEVPRELWEGIFSKVFNQKVIIDNNVIYDSNNNKIYFENSKGVWGKTEYDSNNNQIYVEYSRGYWEKQEFDSNNNIIYVEDSDGFWVKKEYDSNNNNIYYEKSYGYWVKREYDENNNKIYYENSDGVWEKREYDENNNIIYSENSDGRIIDNR